MRLKSKAGGFRSVPVLIQDAALPWMIGLATILKSLWSGIHDSLYSRDHLSNVFYWSTTKALGDLWRSIYDTA
jgi:hypothetical protein